MNRSMLRWLEEFMKDIGVAWFILGFGTTIFTNSMTVSQIQAAVIFLVLGIFLVVLSAILCHLLGGK